MPDFFLIWAGNREQKWRYYERVIMHYEMYFHDIRAFNITIHNFIHFILSRLETNSPENYAAAPRFTCRQFGTMEVQKELAGDIPKVRAKLAAFERITKDCRRDAITKEDARWAKDYVRDLLYDAIYRMYSERQIQHTSHTPRIPSLFMT